MSYRQLQDRLHEALLIQRKGNMNHEQQAVVEAAIQWYQADSVGTLRSARVKLMHSVEALLKAENKPLRTGITANTRGPAK